MDFLKKIASEAVEKSTSTEKTSTEKKDESSNDLAGKIFSGVNSALGGGEKGEKNEDGLDKAIDYVQEHVFKMGAQTNESAVEQATDKQIASAIRSGFKNVTGKDFPIAAASDKESTSEKK